MEMLTAVTKGELCHRELVRRDRCRPAEVESKQVVTGGVMVRVDEDMTVIEGCDEPELARQH